MKFKSFKDLIRSLPLCTFCKNLTKFCEENYNKISHFLIAKLTNKIWVRQKQRITVLGCSLRKPTKLNETQRKLV